MSITAVELQDERVVVTGGSRGLGRGMVEALLARGAQVTVIARDPARLADVERLGAAARPGDVTDPALMNAVVADVKPSVLILNAGATPLMAPLDEQSWDAFTAVWDTDVRAGLYGIQAALKAPLADGARVLLVSSGAAIAGNPLKQPIDIALELPQAPPQHLQIFAGVPHLDSINLPVVAAHGAGRAAIRAPASSSPTLCRPS
jgi:NAD(P)-dependent dehydrogenase (short-subunit alcohol dehydrogenase family)